MPASQAGRRRFDPGLPLFEKKDLGGTTKTVLLSEVTEIKTVPYVKHPTEMPGAHIVLDGGRSGDEATRLSTLL